jgi:hypothetical protein
VEWLDDGDTSSTIQFLCPGSYTVRLTDALDSVVTDTAYITDPQPLHPGFNVGTIACYGDSAPVTITLTGGTPPYQGTGVYMAPAGVQHFTVSDSGGCSTSFSVTITQPSRLLMQIIANSLRCYGDSATVTVTATGGTPQYTGTGTFRLTGGMHHIIVTDLLGCMVEDSVDIPKPLPILVSAIADTNIICSNDTAVICATSGFAHYHWNSGDTASCARVQAAGNYYVTVTDQNNCTAESNHVGIMVHPPIPISIIQKGDTLIAYNAFSYQWYRNGQQIPNATSEQYVVSEPGSYSVVLSDSFGCTSSSGQFLISSINDLSQSVFNLYPNPATTLLVVQQHYNNAIVRLINSLGQPVKEFEVNEPLSHFNITDIPAGIYEVAFFYRNELLQVKKMVKQ